MNRKSLLLMALVATMIGSAQAAPKLKPGKWKITTTMENPMMAAPGEQVTEECIRDSEYDFKQLMQELPQTNCEPVKPKTSGRTVTWELSCINPMNPAEKITGQGHFTGKRDSAEGIMRISMNLPGMGEQTFTTRWHHEYLGKCD
ncbi:MAG: DUF3617 family protein [Gammaproteobacteria bacterium]